VDEPELLEPGERIDGWEILHLPGHADGHLALLRHGVLIAGDTLLATISPVVGLYNDARPDPLGDFLSSLARIVELAPRIAYTGHRAAIEDPAGRARELVAHHAHRLELTAEALDGEPVTAFEISHAIFPDPLSCGLRRFALAEALAHVEELETQRTDLETALRGLTSAGPGTAAIRLSGEERVREALAEATAAFDP